MYGEEYEQWREQRALEKSALGKLTEDEINALKKMGLGSAEDQRDRKLHAELRRLSQQNQQASLPSYLGFGNQMSAFWSEKNRLF